MKLVDRESSPTATAESVSDGPNWSVSTDSRSATVVQPLRRLGLVPITAGRLHDGNFRRRSGGTTVELRFRAGTDPLYSANRRGSAFVIRAIGTMQTSDIDISSSRVLIADDIQQNRELLEAYLVEEGYQILMASDGQQTMQIVEHHQPDLILLDIMMPRMSGYEVCSQIKADPAKRGIPVLMVTALNEAGDIEKAVNAGCDDFLTKPVSRLELRTRVRSLLRVRHLTNERDRLLAYLEEMEHRILRGDG